MPVFDDGGPAFALPGSAGDQWSFQPGMTLRDYFAAAALAGIVGRGASISYEWAAQAAYQFADALIAERKKADGAR